MVGRGGVRLVSRKWTNEEFCIESSLLRAASTTILLCYLADTKKKRENKTNKKQKFSVKYLNFHYSSTGFPVC